MKIFTLAPRENWICDRIAAEWKNNFPEVNTGNIEEADIIWLLAGWCWNQIPVHFLKNKKVVMTVHHIVPEKFDLKKFNEFIFRDQFIDCYHVPSSKTAEMVSKLTKKPVVQHCYWYDSSFWRPQNKLDARIRLNLKQNDFIVGSFQRDTEGSDLKSPKLEKGPDIFCDFLEFSGISQA